MRNVAFNLADGDLICYLDSDDCLTPKHLEIIANQFTDDISWCYFNDFLVLDKEFKQLYKRINLPRFASVGTSSICHRNPKKLLDGYKLSWSSGYGHDFCYMMKLNSLGWKFKKLEKDPGYIVCHYGGGNRMVDY
jgi:glycosyltransferase involved in cell wall biosynthesis